MPETWNRGGARARRLRPARHTGAPSSERAVVTPVRVAVTGGIGAGKTALSQALCPHALSCADADQVAREIVAPGMPALQEIAQLFGSQVMNTDGTLNRQALAQIVFNDASARQELDRITHPRIAERVREILDVQGSGFTLYDIPLLVTAEEAARFDEVIVVTAPEKDRIERLQQRGLSKEDALSRIRSQITDEERIKLATILVENTGNAEDLATLGKEIALTWLQCAGEC